MTLPKNLFLGAGAFGIVYYVGVLRALFEANINDLTLYGNSAGALVSVFYILQIPTDELIDRFSSIVENATWEIIANPIKIKSYQMTQHVFTVFDIIHKHSLDAYKKCSGRLKIGVTLANGGFQWKDNFTSQADFFNTLLCSSNVPYLFNYDAIINGDKCIDGGYGFVSSRDLPEDTFTILLGGINNSGGISANIPFVHRMFPPPKYAWEMYMKNGYDDMKYRIESGKVKQNPPTINDVLSSEIENMVASIDVLFFVYKLQQESGIHMYDYSTLVERYK